MRFVVSSGRDSLAPGTSKDDEGDEDFPKTNGYSALPYASGYLRYMRTLPSTNLAVNAAILQFHAPASITLEQPLHIFSSDYSKNFCKKFTTGRTPFIPCTMGPLQSKAFTFSSRHQAQSQSEKFNDSDHPRIRKHIGEGFTTRKLQVFPSTIRKLSEIGVDIVFESTTNQQVIAFPNP
ncbi:hypothetical protein BYT27DRAFT_7253677 [Phlegmacium glaucopus]|nr:hypothetical protein BYT27DRAFT_7253677 [Phlegmacium glaucopus]